jgi:hypothetical protein
LSYLFGDLLEGLLAGNIDRLVAEVASGKHKGGTGTKCEDHAFHDESSTGIEPNIALALVQRVT